jgi:hypothetical protein
LPHTTVAVDGIDHTRAFYLEIYVIDEEKKYVSLGLILVLADGEKYKRIGTMNFQWYDDEYLTETSLKQRDWFRETVCYKQIRAIIII